MKIRKIIVGTLVAVTLLATTVFATTTTSFSDVQSGDWAYAAIMKATNLKMFSGTSMDF